MLWRRTLCCMSPVQAPLSLSSLTVNKNHTNPCVLCLCGFPCLPPLHNTQEVSSVKALVVMLVDLLDVSGTLMGKVRGGRGCRGACRGHAAMGGARHPHCCLWFGRMVSRMRHVSRHPCFVSSHQCDTVLLVVTPPLPPSTPSPLTPARCVTWWATTPLCWLAPRWTCCHKGAAPRRWQTGSQRQRGADACRCVGRRGCVSRTGIAD